MVIKRIPKPTPPIPDQVIDELHEKLLNRFRIYNIKNHPDKEFLKKHTVVNHETYQVTIFLKQFLDGHKFTNNITIQFKKPPIEYQEVEQKELGNNIVVVNSKSNTNQNFSKQQKQALNTNSLIKVDNDKQQQRTNQENNRQGK